MGARIQLTSTDGFVLNAYRAEPQGRPRGGVVVIHEVWGVNTWVRSVVDRFARQGFLAVAPNLFDRLDYGFESENYGPDHFASIAGMMKAFDYGTAMTDAAASVASVSAAGKVGLTGYCFGGRMTWRAAHEGLGIAAASGYYGGGIPSYIDLAPIVPLEMHYGDQDKGIPLEQIEALKARHPEVGIHVYAAGHGFCNSDKASFNAEACEAASARTLAFFTTHLA